MVTFSPACRVAMLRTLCNCVAEATWPLSRRSTWANQRDGLNTKPLVIA